MTKEEALAKIEELKAFIEEESKIGFENDEIFLLSKEEYEKYRHIIPEISNSWWLRTPRGIASVLYVCCAFDGDAIPERYFSDESHAVRPAIKLNSTYPVGTIISKYANRWVVIDKEKKIAISCCSIGHLTFDKNGNNDYKVSEIRNFLLNWINEAHTIIED